MKIHIALISIFILSHKTMAQQEIVGDLPEHEIIYYCGPCGCANDGKYFNGPGQCQACPMALQPTLPGLNRPTSAARRPTVGMFLFDGADVLDVTGPISVFEHAQFNIVTFSKATDPVRIGMNLELQPDYTMGNLPPVDVIVLPGGGMSESNPGDTQVVQFLRERKDTTDVFLSVCSGAFFLGEAGLLDGQDATTFAALIPSLSAQYPKARVLNDVKYVDNGQIVTSAGLSSGIDAAFQVVAKFYGEGRAQDIANHMEYPWDKTNSYARSQLADGYAIGIRSLVSMFSTEFYFSSGDHNAWEYRFKLTHQMEPKTIIALIKKELEKSTNWHTTQSNLHAISGTIEHAILGRGKISITILNEGPEAIIKAKRMARYKREVQ